MLEVLKELLGSKKALTAIAGIILAIASRYGLNVPEELVQDIVQLLSVYIVGQGIADHGKEAEKIKAGASR